MGVEAGDGRERWGWPGLGKGRGEDGGWSKEGKDTVQWCVGGCALGEDLGLDENSLVRRWGWKGRGEGGDEVVLDEKSLVRRWG